MDSSRSKVGEGSRSWEKSKESAYWRRRKTLCLVRMSGGLEAPGNEGNTPLTLRRSTEPKRPSNQTANSPLSAGAVKGALCAYGEAVLAGPYGFLSGGVEDAGALAFRFPAAGRFDRRDRGGVAGGSREAGEAMVSLGNASRGPGAGVGEGGTVRSAVVGGTHLSPAGGHPVSYIKTVESSVSTHRLWCSSFWLLRPRPPRPLRPPSHSRCQPPCCWRRRTWLCPFPCPSLLSPWCPCW